MSEFTDQPIDTGFAELTVTVSEPAAEPEVAPEKGLTPQGLNALKAMVAMPKEFGTPQMAALARDIAMNIYPIETILQNHRLTNAQYDFLSEHNEFFKNSVAQQANEWQGVKNTQDRLRAQAAAALEEQLPVIASRMGQKSEKLADAVEAAKLFAKIAAVDTDTGGARRGGEGFTISIDLGADTRITVGYEGAPTAPAEQGRGVSPGSNGEGAREVRSLQAVPQGQGDNGALRQIAQGASAPASGGAIPEG